ASTLLCNGQSVLGLVSRARVSLRPHWRGLGRDLLWSAGDTTMSAETVRYRTMRGRKTPPGFNYFCRAYLKLSGSEMDRLWHALSQAKWALAVEVRSAIQCLASIPDTTEGIHHILVGPLSPPKLISAIEALVHEGLMVRVEANQLSEKVLSRTDKEGRW